MDRILLIIVIFFLGVGAYLALNTSQRPLIVFDPLTEAPPIRIQAQMVQTAESIITPQSDDIRVQRGIDVLHGIGNNNPSPEIIQFMVEWSNAEDHGDDANNRNNPYNTTQDGFNNNGCHMADCVRAYPTWVDGLAATLQTLSYSDYRDIVAALRNNDPVAAKAALVASPWAASHYNGGW